MAAEPEPHRKKKSTDWELNPEDLTVVEEVGHGSTSRVYLGRLGDKYVAIKEIAEVDENTLLAVKRELQVMTRVHHPHLLKFVGLISLKPPLRLCLEFCAGGTLFDLLHNRWDIPLSWTQRMTMLVDISAAMEYLHTSRKQIIHRDLKSLNIFLFEAVDDDKTMPIVKIADFGFARIREKLGSQEKDWPTLTRCAGSMHWMAPEVYQGTHYHEKADTFSYSIVTYEIICRHMAFEDFDPVSAGEKISAGERPSLDAEFVPADTPAGLVDLMLECWSQDAEKRPTFPEIHRRLLEIQEVVTASA